MNQFIKLSLALVVLQAMSSMAMPTTTDQPSKDMIFDFLLDKVYEMKASTALNFAATHDKLYKESIELLESLKNSGDEKYQQYDEQFFADVKKDLAHFEETVEQLKKDKSNCELQHDLSLQIWELRVRTRENLHKEDIIEKWRKSDKEDNEFQFENIDKTYAEIKEQLPQVIAKYTASLGETEKQAFEAELAREPNVYAALTAIFKDKFSVLDGSGTCQNFGTSLVAKALETLAKP